MTAATSTESLTTFRNILPVKYAGDQHRKRAFGKWRPVRVNDEPEHK